MKNNPASMNLSSIRDNRKRGSAFNYTNAKQILEIYRLLCQGRKEPFEELCGIFNSETNQGKDMNNFELVTWLVMK